MTKKLAPYADGSLQHVHIARIIKDEEKVKYRSLDRKWAAELQADIEKNGLDVPLLVWNGAEESGGALIDLGNGKKVPATILVAGLHRLHALKALRKSNESRYTELFPDGIPVYVRSGTLVDVLSAQLRENVQRKDITPEEILPILTRLRDEHGLKNVAIAKRIGKSTSWVSQMMAIPDELGEEAMSEVQRGGIDVRAARKVATEVRKGRKAGKQVSPKEAVIAARERTIKRKATGKQRSDKRLSAKRLWELYENLPRLSTSLRVSILEGCLQYLADATSALPGEITVLVARETANQPEKPKKGKKE